MVGGGRRAGGPHPIYLSAPAKLKKPMNTPFHVGLRYPRIPGIDGILLVFIAFCSRLGGAIRATHEVKQFITSVIVERRLPATEGARVQDSGLKETNFRIEIKLTTFVFVHLCPYKYEQCSKITLRRPNASFTG